MMKKIVAMMFAVATVGAQELPDRMLSGYTGMFLGQETKHVEKMIGELAKHQFNSIEVKIQQHNVRKMTLGTHEKQVASLIDMARKSGLIFQIYLYPIPGDGCRRADWNEHKNLPALVDGEGRTVSNSFSLISPAVWRELFEHARQFAHARKRLGFAALKFDIETINYAYSFDDAAWTLFCKSHPSFPVTTPAARRAALLRDENAMKTYETFFQNEVAKAVKTFADDLHKIDPTLVLGYMPAHHGWLSDVFNRSLATDRTPAIVDGWDLYNGEGWTPKIAEHAKRVRLAHKNNRFVPWLRPNSYEPEDIAISAYYAAAHCDGYSLWVLTMLDESTNKRRGYELPGGRRALLYWEAFGQANQAVKADLKEKTLHTPKRIAYKKAKMLVAPLDYSKTAIPELIPAGSGKLDGSVGRFVLRDQRNIWIHAKAGEEIKVTLEHLAGKSRPIALHYALLDANKKVLREEAVSVGAKDTFTVIAPRTGVFALIVSGGEGGQAWYGVTVHTSYFALDAKHGTYLFGPQTVYAPGAAYGNKELLLTMTPAESHIHQVDGAGKVEVVRTGKTLIALPGKVHRIDFTDSRASYSQNFMLSFPKGALPLIYSSPERMLVRAK